MEVIIGNKFVLLTYV